MVKHNNQLPGNHFHKDWQRRVKTWVRGRERRRLHKSRRARRFEVLGHVV